MKYIINESQLIDLLKDRDKLELLESYGVDNWEGYGMWHEDEDYEEPDYKSYVKYVSENFERVK